MKLLGGYSDVSPKSPYKVEALSVFRNLPRKAHPGNTRTEKPRQRRRQKEKGTEASNTLNIFLNVGTFRRKTKSCKRLFKGEYVQRCMMARNLSPRYNLKLAVTSTLYPLIRVDTPLNRRSRRFVFCRPATP